MTIKTLREIQDENYERVTANLELMARALLRARGNSDWTIRAITHAVEQCADTIGRGHFEAYSRDKALDEAILAIVESLT